MVGEGITTRLAQTGDAVRIGRLLDALRAELGYTGQVSVPLPVGHEGPLFVVLAEVDGELGGVVVAQRWSSLVRGERVLLLTDVYVLHKFRRRSVATCLLNEVAALGRRLGCDSMSMIIENANEGALRTAQRAGFQRGVQDLLLHCSLS